MKIKTHSAGKMAPVEVDETYVGGKMKGGKRGRWSENKTLVLGIVERKGKIKTAVIGNVRKATLQPIIEDMVEWGTTVYIDELLSYNGLRKAGYEHRQIQHADKVYVLGDIHTQTVDGFWGNFKNSIRGVHHH